LVGPINKSRDLVIHKSLVEIYDFKAYCLGVGSFLVEFVFS
jgi:hypothetical protein